jgi:hypothetical protein
MPPRKIKVVDVISPQEYAEGYACDDNVLPEAIEDIDPYPKDDKPVEEQTPQQPSPQGLGHEEQVAQVEQVAQPVSNIKTVELVECPDCKKKMTKKTLKYSHAKNCTAKVPSVEEAKEEEEPETEEEEEEVKPCAKQQVAQVPTPPVLKRTVSVARPKQPPPVKKTVNKVKQPQPTDISNVYQPQQPTPTNIYGRENRNERAKQKTEKMCNLFVNAF